VAAELFLTRNSDGTDRNVSTLQNHLKVRPKNNLVLISNFSWDNYQLFLHIGRTLQLNYL